VKVFKSLKVGAGASMWGDYKGALQALPT